MLMGCNHFHLARVITEFAGNDENLTIAEVSKSMFSLTNMKSCRVEDCGQL
jgi:hypothetical protein